MKNYQISEEAIKNLLLAMDEVPTKWGRGLQDYLRGNVKEIIEEIKEEPKEAQAEPNLEEVKNND